MAVEALDAVVRAGKGMTRTGDDLPTGFSGPAKGWRSLVPAAGRTLQLPRDRQRLAARTGDAPRFDAIEVTAFTESQGRIEDAIAAWANALADGGTLVLDVDNVQSARMLRIVLDGRPGACDPAGSAQDASQALPLRRVLAAAAAAGLVVRDVLGVPGGGGEFGVDVARRLFEVGLLPFDWLGGAPPARYWLVCEKVRPLAGSVLLAGDDPAARARTEAALRAFLPVDWEIVTGDAIGPCAQWNRAIAAARGDVVWFLRAGAEPDAAAFAALAVRAETGPVAPARDGQRLVPGDVVGLMLPRLDALAVGPLPEHYENTRVALEDYVLRLDCKLPTACLVDAPFATSPAPIESPARLPAEAAQLGERWATTPSAATATVPPPPPAPWHGREPRITLCMITRDEERFLEQCLTRVRAAVDEIVVVDTGSTDRTVAIARAFGATVLHRAWDDDFSAPRNVGIAAATGDWILVLDADEFVVDGAVERLRELARDPSVLGYHLRFVNDYGDGQTLGVMMVRLFRNLPGIAYENVIHEQVTPSLQRIGAPLGLKLVNSDVEVVHHGYAEDVMARRGKTERNERLFVKQLRAHPDDIYSHYKYGDFLRRVPGRSADAKRLLDRCLELILAGPPALPRGLPYAGEVAALCALEAERAGERERAREIVDLALRRFVPTPNLHYLAAGLALADGRADVAITHYRRCLTYRGQVLIVPIQEGITGHVSLAGIAQAHLLRGDFDRAERLLERAIALEPDYEVAHLALSRLWLVRGDSGRSLRVLTDFLARHPDATGACQQTMLILQRLGRTTAARRMGDHTVRLLETRSQEREAAAVREILATL